MSRLSPAEIRKAEEEMETTPEQVLAQHTAETKPHHTDTSKANDFESAPGRWNAPTCSICGRAAAHAKLAAENAAKQKQD